MRIGYRVKALCDARNYFCSERLYANPLRNKGRGSFQQEPSAKPSGRIIGLRTVVIHKYLSVTKIAEQGATQFTDIRWS